MLTSVVCQSDSLLLMKLRHLKMTRFKQIVLLVIVFQQNQETFLNNLWLHLIQLILVNQYSEQPQLKISGIFVTDTHSKLLNQIIIYCHYVSLAMWMYNFNGSFIVPRLSFHLSCHYLEEARRRSQFVVQLNPSAQHFQ